MKLGISTWAYQDLPLRQALERISSLSDRAEILCEAKHSLLCPENLESTSSVILHRRAIQASAKAGAELYVIHPGFTSWSYYRRDAQRSLDQSLSELAFLQEELGIRS